LVLGTLLNCKITTAADLQRALFDADVLDRGYHGEREQRVGRS
jgi:hypothetical protein